MVLSLNNINVRHDNNAPIYETGVPKDCYASNACSNIVGEALFLLQIKKTL